MIELLLSQESYAQPGFDEKWEAQLVEYPGVRSLVREISHIVDKYFSRSRPQVALKVDEEDEEPTLLYTIKRDPAIDKNQFWDLFVKADDEYLKLLRENYNKYPDGQYLIFRLG
ncbi:MAG: hypothetical protein N3A68_07170 [Bacteroidia bacterium]|jgi:hypothetical protein|nr:hypothetical protein [Bacteroidia bacterium]GIV22382.1 MAG: hypothetical protein KatS3mg025_0041 [Bacteroidia bacterium]